MKRLLLFLAFLFLASPFFAQEKPSPLSDTEKQEVIDSISQKLNTNYVFPEVAKKMTALIGKNHKGGAYQQISQPQAFAEQLTKDLQSISKDLHLRVRFAPEQIAEMRAHRENDSEEVPQSWIDQMRRNNYGFKEVKILDGNIGYLDLRGFNDTRYASETATAAMNFLSGADAIIIDLRNNGGGSPDMIQLITSYLYGPERVHLNNFYWRPTDEHTQTWTLPYVPGKRNPNADVYVLTSKNTFSAAEEFSYNLRNLERATLVGEVTGGGAHPGGTQVATDRFTVWVPQGRAINPITKTNWEGTGVKPHIEVPATDALVAAQSKALEKLLDKTEDKDAKFKYEWAIQSLNAQLNPVEVDEKTLKSYAGHYGERILTFEKGKLHYQRTGRAKYELKALNDDLFMFDEAPYFRLKVMKENGKVIGLKGLYDNGHTDQSMKTDAQP